jgi:hypothetical protein
VRHDSHLTGTEDDRSVPELDRQQTLQDQEQLVFLGVRVPDELALELDQLDVLAVELRHDPRAPALVEARELLGQVDSLGPVHRARLTAGIRRV